MPTPKIERVTTTRIRRRGYEVTRLIRRGKPKSKSWGFKIIWYFCNRIPSLFAYLIPKTKSFLLLGITNLFHCLPGVQALSTVSL